MKKQNVGILVGLGAAVLDTTPMIIQGLPWSATISAFVTWVVIGFFIATTNLKLPSALKGIVIALLILTSSAPLIGAEDYKVLLLPILPTTIVLGALSGWLIERLSKNK